MNWQGLEVQHDQYGVGRIRNVDDRYLTVRFESVGDKLFQFPQALGGILRFEDLEARAEAHRLTEEHKEAVAARDERNELLRSRIEVDLEEELLKRYKKQQRTLKRKARSAAGSRNRSNALFKCELYDGDDEAPDFNAIAFADYAKGQELASDEVQAQSDVFNTWTVHAGTFISGQKKGQGIRMAKARPHSLCVLSVLPEKAEEEERIITALFLVDRSYEGDEETPAWLQNTKPEFRLKFTEDEAYDLKVWRYYSNQTNPERIRIGSGLFRYMDDVQAAHILRAVADLLKGTEREQQAKNFFETYCHLNQLDPAVLRKDEGPLSAHFDEQHEADEDDETPEDSLEEMMEAVEASVDEAFDRDAEEDADPENEAGKDEDDMNKAEDAENA